jgi:hypothetical protein
MREHVQFVFEIANRLGWRAKKRYQPIHQFIPSEIPGQIYVLLCIKKRIRDATCVGSTMLWLQVMAYRGEP